MSDDRDDKGRFLPGCRGGPGRPRRDSERAYLDAVIGACPLDRWRTIVERAVADAVNGDRHAREWLTHILLPSPDVAREAEVPEPTLDLTRLTDEELQTLRRIMEKGQPDADAAN